MQTTVEAAPPRVSEARAAAACGAVGIAGWLTSAIVMRFGGDALAAPSAILLIGGVAAASVLPVGWFRRGAFGLTLAAGGLASVVGVLAAQAMGGGLGALVLIPSLAMYFAAAYAVAGLALFAAFGTRLRDGAAVLGGFCLGGVVAGVIAGVAGSGEITLATPLLFIWIPGAIGGALAADRINGRGV